MWPKRARHQLKRVAQNYIFAKISQSTAEQKAKDIEIYKKADSGVMKAYENICHNLDRQEDAQSSILFGTSFINTYNEVINKLGKEVYGN